MRTRSLVTQLWISFCLLLFCVMMPLEFALHHVLDQFYSTQVTEPLLYHSQQLAAMLSVDAEAIQVAPMMGQMVGGEVIVLDETGRPQVFKGAAQVAPPESGVVAVMMGRSFVGQMETPEGRQFIVTGVPIPGGRGGVLLMAPAEPVQQSLRLARRYLWMAGGVTLLLGTGLALMVARRLTRPVLAMERATRAIAQGDFSVRVHVTSADEIGLLGQAINRMTAQLATYENRRREFLANVAHELRTPLSYIRGYTQAIVEGIVTEPTDVERYQRVVLDETIRVGRLVDDLLDLAQMDEGYMGFELLKLDLRVPINLAVATVLPRAEEKGIAVAVNIPAPLPMVTADGGRIQQVLFNLVDNAVRHTPVGGQISVSAEASGSTVTVQVRDNGEGIDPDLLPLIFDRFQGHRGGGRGLGLAVVRSIIRAHGGDVGVESQRGKGSAFWFRLPVPESSDGEMRDGLVEW